MGIWRGGLWRHDWHDGRYGWWWLVGGIWYFYDQPIYPYPLMVSPIAIPEEMEPPPVVAAPPPAGFWYYCDNPPGYYPYVTTCTVPYRAVPAQP